ncbi:NLR family CARD domain-containing protein 4-like [Amphiura filiformis]|uniref:NLR family CARD domain-containing protein 4-like n=1 Tax=Amphiura filiformis TaxID=82378 RepID=UPI003B224665
MDNPGEQHQRADAEELVGKVQEDSSSYDLIQVQSQLKADYKAKRNGFVFVPGVTDLPLEDYFVDLSIIRRESRPTEVTLHELTTYTDLVTLEDNRKDQLTHILVGADVGLGKTTLINRLALDWASLPQDDNSNDVICFDKTQNPLDKFELVFAFDANKLQTHMNLIDAIHNQLLPGMSKSAIKAMLTAHGDKILYLFDGYDELKSHQNVLNSKHLNRGYVIVTTRLNMVDEFSSHYDRYVHVAIVGVVWKSRKTFINNFLNQADRRDHISKDAIDLWEHLNQSHLNQISCHPLMLATTCSIFKNRREIPLRMTTLYSQAIYDFAMHFYAKSIPIETCTEKEISEVDELILALGSPALKGLLYKETKLVFDKEDIDTIGRFQFVPTNAWLVVSCSVLCACIGLEVGLRLESLQLSLILAIVGFILGTILLSVKINHFFNITERGENIGLLKRVSNPGKTATKRAQYVFLHKTFQEFTAAKYWSSLVLINRAKFDYYLTHITRDNVVDVQYLIRFCCGLDSESASVILQHVGTNCEVDGHFIQTLLFEAETDSDELPNLQDILS